MGSCKGGALWTVLVSRERFEQLYRELWRSVYAVCYALLGDVEDAQDAALEVFVRKWRARHRYDPARGSFKAWLIHNAVCLCMDMLRRRKRRRRMTEQVGQVSEVPPSSQDLAITVEQCLAHLEPERRMLLLMRDVLGLTWEEIASAADLSVGAVRRRVADARRQMRKCLGEGADA